MTVELRIDSEGDVRATDIYESVIRSDKRLSYEQVQRWLDGDRRSVPRALHETLRWLRAAVARLAAVREARGGVAFLREDTKVSLDEKTQEPTSFAARPSLASHMFIERLMVATKFK